MPDISDDLIPATPRKPDWERAMLEKVAMASIREQQANRRWKTFVRMAWLLFFAVLAWMFFQRGAPDAAKMTSPRCCPSTRAVAARCRPASSMTS